MEGTGAPDSNESTSNNESSSHQPSVNETSFPNATTDLTCGVPNNGSSFTAETEASEGDDNSNVRSVDLPASVVNGFEDGHGTGKEVGPFRDAIPDLDERSIDDDGARAWREDNSEQEIETGQQCQQKMTLAQKVLSLTQFQSKMFHARAQSV